MLLSFQTIQLYNFFFFLIFIKPQLSENTSLKCEPKSCESLCCSSYDTCATQNSDCSNSACEASLCFNKCCVNGQCGTYDGCQQTQLIVVIILSCLMGLFVITFFIICIFAIYIRIKKRKKINQSDNTIDRNPEIIRTDQIPFMEPQQTKKEKIPLQEIEIGLLPISRRLCFNPIQINHKKKMNTEYQIQENIKGLPLLTIAMTDGPVKVTEEFEQISGFESEVSSSNAAETPKEHQKNIDQKLCGYVQKQFQTMIKKIQNGQSEEESEEFNETDVKRSKEASPKKKKEKPTTLNSLSLSLKKMNQKSRFMNLNQKQIEEGNINNNENQQNQNDKIL